MESKKVSKYEQQRLANIKQNADMLAALNIHSTLTRLNDLSKRQKRKYTKKPRNVSHVVRSSLRCRGMAPEDPTNPSQTRQLPYDCKPGPIKMGDAFVNNSGLDDRKLIETILGVPKKSHVSHSTRYAHEVTEKGDNSSALDSFRLGPRKIAPVFQDKIFSMRFLPSNDKSMIVVGGDHGNLGFWNVDDGDRMYVYRPHSAHVSGIVFQQFSMSKMFTCCYGGFIRLMDVEKEMFDLAYSGADSIYSISQRPDDVNSLYFSEGRGELNVWDGRTGKPSFTWGLHEARINSIHFNACNTNMMATSSSDGTACIWDLRKVVADKAEALNTVNHERAVHSAYFSPSGNILATTSLDDTIKLLSGANYENVSKIHHNNHTGGWISSFRGIWGWDDSHRGIWGWDDSHVFIGNMKGVDVISTAEKRCIDTLVIPEVTAIPCRFDVHPHKFGMLAGATSGGQVYLWTSSS